jgi:RNA polymerase sigma-70 factor (ECF subfamily)
MLSVYLSMVETPEDKHKVEQLYSLYKEAMFNKAKSVLRDDSLSEDAVHSSFIKIIKNLSNINEFSCPQTFSYCVTICGRTAIDMKRGEHREKFIDMDKVPDNFLDEIPDNTNIENEVILKMDKEKIADIISQLPDIYKEAIHLYYSNGLPLKQIAETLHITRETAKKRLQRARQKLLSMLKQEGFEFV